MPTFLVAIFVTVVKLLSFVELNFFAIFYIFVEVTDHCSSLILIRYDQNIRYKGGESK